MLSVLTFVNVAKPSRAAESDQDPQEAVGLYEWYDLTSFLQYALSDRIYQTTIQELASANVCTANCNCNNLDTIHSGGILTSRSWHIGSAWWTRHNNHNSCVMLVSSLYNATEQCVCLSTEKTHSRVVYICDIIWHVIQVSDRLC